MRGTLEAMTYLVRLAPRAPSALLGTRRNEEEPMEGLIGQAEEVPGGHAPLSILLAQKEGQGHIKCGPPRSGIEAHLRFDDGVPWGSVFTLSL